MFMFNAIMLPSVKLITYFTLGCLGCRLLCSASIHGKFKYLGITQMVQIAELIIESRYHITPAG